jgi:hypothetical protein
MSASGVSTIYLLEVASRIQVAAELRDAIEEANLADWHTKWLPALIEILHDLVKKGVPLQQWPQSLHWNWRKKVAQIEGLLAFKGFSVVCGDVTQGLMRIDLNELSRIPETAEKPIVYVDYLENAPWNRSELGQTARYRGVGSALMAAAATLSIDEGFKGRVGLHSLPQADDFYRNTCGMTDLGPDKAYQGLRYFEMTAEQSQKFLQEEDGQ